MFGRIHIRAPTNGDGKVCSGQVTLLRTKTDDLRVVLSSLSTHESQAFVATARGSSSQGFSIDVVRANEKEQWGENQQITVNWFAWGSEVEKFLTSEKRGSLRLDNSSRVEAAHYRISFNPTLPRVPKAIVASARNANRAQVLVVNVVGQPTTDSFVVHVKRLDEGDARVEEDGTFIDWIATFGDDFGVLSQTNRTGSGTKFSPAFPALVPVAQTQRIFVIHTVTLSSTSTSDLFVTSAIIQTNRGFSLSKFIPIKTSRSFEASESSIATQSDLSPTVKMSKRLLSAETKSVTYIAWQGQVDECDWDSQCSLRGSCLFSLLSDDEELIPESTCACRSPYAGYACDEECPKDFDTDLVCSGNGLCSQETPTCECFNGWTGDICAARAVSYDSRFVLFIGLSLVVFFSSLCGVWIATKCRRRRSRERKLRHLRLALLGDDGSQVPRERFEQMDTALHGEARSWAIPFEKLTLGVQIGQGSSSQVFMGLWANQPVAVKKISVSRKQQRDKSLKTDTSSQDVWLYFKREAGFLSTLHHPNIVRFFGVASQQDYRVHGVVDYFYIVTELCSSSLSDLIRGPVLRRPPRLGDGVNDEETTQFVLSVIKQICLGMDFLHSKDVVHRDLKCDNVLLDVNNQVRLCDFGISRVVDRSKGFIQGTTAMIATPAFMAPELIMTGTYPCGTKSDVFSFGIVMWSFLTWKEPYEELQNSHSVFDLLSQITMHGLRPKVKQGQWPAVLEEKYLEMVETDPVKRPSFGDLLSWFDRPPGSDAVVSAWMYTVSTSSSSAKNKN